MVVQAPQVSQGRAPVVTVKVPDDPRAGRWFGGKPAIQGNVLAAPLPAEAADTHASKLFPKAVWEKPKDPLKVLYADQIVNGLLMQDLTSDAPGTFRIKITQDVVDRWGGVKREHEDDFRELAFLIDAFARGLVRDLEAQAR